MNPNPHLSTATAPPASGRMISLALAILAALPLARATAEGTVPAFPGAEGFGARTPGGRGGRVILVTNLLDQRPSKKEPPAPGSLRAAVMASGPRIIVFRVAGMIALDAPLDIVEPYVTIAGQSAPGGGICLKNHDLRIRTHDVIVRHLRVRVGDEAAATASSGKGFSPDAISVAAPSRNVIIDHCSASWAIDETLSVSGEGITDVTVQWCLIAESLHHSTHAKGAHGYGSLIRTNGNVTFHHNLYAHHASRCPRPGTYGEGSVLLDFRNNVIHDGHGYSSDDPVRMNYVANSIKRPRDEAFEIGGPATRVFVAGNVQVGSRNTSDDPWLLVTKDGDPASRAQEEFPAAPVTTQSAEDAYRAVLSSGGATLPKRDAVDTRILQQLESGTGGLIDSQKEVGGWPEPEPGEAPADTDGDALPDSWERAHGLDPENSADGARDTDGDGYPNLEEWLNGTDPNTGGTADAPSR